MTIKSQLNLWSIWLVQILRIDCKTPYNCFFFIFLWHFFFDYVIQSLHLHTTELTRRSVRNQFSPMDVLLPCASLRSVNLKPESTWRFLLPSRNRRFSDLLKCRRKTISTELQAAVDVADRNDNGSVSIQSYKVTVHDRERGVVHEFVVPEVRHYFQFSICSRRN